MYSTTSSRSSEGIRISASGIQKLEPLVAFPVQTVVDRPVQSLNYGARTQSSSILPEAQPRNSNLKFLQEATQK